MKKGIAWLLLLCLLTVVFPALAAESKTERISLPDPRFLPLGRHDPKEEKATLWWSGAGVRLTLACTWLEAEFTSSADHHAPWIGVMIDGAPVTRFPLLPGTHRYPLLAGMEKGVTHEVTVLRDSQPTDDEQGPVILEAVYTDGTVSTPAERPFLIEFIGDSLTVGEGCLGPEGAGEWRMAWFSQMHAFPTLVSEQLNAEMRVIALSGWGAAWSWDNKTECRLGRIYGQLCGVTPGGGRRVDFPERPADAVVINLGTNDGSALSKLSQEKRRAAEKELRLRAGELMNMVRQKNPKALILWAYGLTSNSVESILSAAVEDMHTAGDAQVAYLSLTPAASYGSRNHPSRDAHRKAAEEIIEALKAMGL